MRKYEFKKFPLLATILTVVGLILSVISVSIALMSDTYVGGYATLAILEIVAAVLVLAGLTTGRVVLLRVISIITMVSLIITAFVLALAKFADKNVFLFALSLLMLIASILELIYYLTLRNERIGKMYFVAGLCFTALVAIYGIYYIVDDVIEIINYALPGHYHLYFLIFAFAFVSVLPPIVDHSLAKKEETTVVEENKDDSETPEEEPQEESAN